MLTFRQSDTYKRSEIEVLRTLTNGPKRWKELRDETELSRQGLLCTLQSLLRKGMIEQEPEKKRGVSYGRTPTTYKLSGNVDRVRERIAESDLVRKDRYGHLKGLVEKILRTEKNKYAQYLMLLNLFTGWSNADLKWVQDQMIWATVALVGKDFETFRDLTRIAKETYTKCFSYLFEVSRKHPVAALALIDSAENEDISDVIDDAYYHVCLPPRDAVLSEALEPLYQQEIPTFDHLKKWAELTIRDPIKHEKHLLQPGEYPVRTEKEIRKMLAYVSR